MQITYLTLAYEGNYVGRAEGSWEVFTYMGDVWVANPVTDEAYQA